MAGLIETLKEMQAPVAAAPVQAPNSWIKDLIAQRYQPKTERLKRAPVGFNFEREPFDPSSYYKQLGQFRDISRTATATANQEASNRAAREAAQANAGIGGALGGVAANFVYNGVSRKYGLKSVSPNTAAAADYFGSKYGIANIGGYRSSGSVPGSDHPKGRAIDLMTNNRSKGNGIANEAVRNYKKWNIKYVIYYRYIWSPGRGWRKYNGPSPHTDHVHISFNK